MAVEKAFIDHFTSAAFVFFGRLENEIDGTGKVGGLGQDFGGTQQHRHMAVMTTGMHFARMLGCIGQIGHFMNIKRVHVGAQTNPFAVTLVAFQCCNHTGFCHAG